MNRTTFSKIARVIYRALFGDDVIIVPITRDMSRLIFELNSAAYSEGIGPNMDEITVQLTEFEPPEYDWVKLQKQIAKV